MGKVIDLIGKRFGRLIVIKRSGSNKDNRAVWSCLCDCGKIKEVVGRLLVTNHTKSCGCLHDEGNNKNHIKHGHKQKGKFSRTYNVWHGMRQRCNNSNSPDYKNYGGRGIIVCKRWKDFRNFLEDMGECPGNYFSIERINNNKGYYKSNCRWATTFEQSRNKRSNQLFTFNKKTQCLSAWAREYKIKYTTLWQRIFKYKWNIKRALLTPIQGNKK